MSKMLGMKFPLYIQRTHLSFGSGATSIAGNQTVYLSCIGESGDFSGFYIITESTVWVTYLVTRPGILKNLVVYTSGAAGAGQSFIYTVRLNGVPTAITCTVSGGVAVSASDLVNSVHVVVGDRVTVQLVLSAGAGTKYHGTSLDFEANMTRPVYDNLTFSGYTGTLPAASTRGIYFAGKVPLGGSIITLDAYPQEFYLITRKGTLKTLVVLAGSAPGLGETFTYTLRVNSIDTLFTAQISGAAQITNANITSVILVNPGDLVSMKVVSSAAAVVTTHMTSFDFEEGDYRA